MKRWIAVVLVVALLGAMALTAGCTASGGAGSSQTPASSSAKEDPGLDLPEVPLGGETASEEPAASTNLSSTSAASKNASTTAPSQGTSSKTSSKTSSSSAASKSTTSSSTTSKNASSTSSGVTLPPDWF